MFNKFIKDIKLIVNNEGGFGVMAAMAVGSLLSANSQRNAKMESQAADAKLQRAKMESARTRGKDTFSTNTRRMREAAQKREIQIESNRLDAESKVDETFAGSGISGTSVNELDDELDAASTRNKYENINALDQQLSDANKSFGDQGEDINLNAENINTTAPKNDVLGNVMGAVGAAASVSGFSSSSLGKKLSKTLGL
jgi:hypothetical protein